VECRGLSKEQLEDIYQETTLALYSRPYDSEEHLRNALRDGIKKRALRLHRDEHRHGQIRARSAPGLRLMAETREEQTAPEPAVLAKEDRLIALEFKTELDEDEQRVFAWLVEGLQYRAVASVLNIPVNEARNTARSCERKRERFQLLYDTGRLCGYRAQTILALQNGEATSEVLAERAFAHLESCGHCRLEHRTNAKRLRRSFRDQAAALLPPVFIGHLGWLARLDLRARLLLHRLGIDTAPVGQGGVRERAVALLAGGGVGAKVAVGVVTVGVLAGGAVATHVLEQSPSPHRHHVGRSAAAAPRAAPATGRLLSAAPAASLSTSVHRSVHTSRRPHHSSSRRVASTRRTNGTSAAGQREPGGFAYLGVPTNTSPPSTSAQAASTSAHQSGGGGQFSP
jgi:DNA-directed RNA polymerase specialized sigma24 family protein